MHPTVGAHVVSDPAALVVALANHGLENLDAGLDFKQDSVGASHEAQVGRLPAGTRHRCLRDGAPTGVTKAHQSFNQASVCGVVDQRRSGRIQSESKVGAEDFCSPSANLIRNAAIASLEPADRCAIDPDGPSHHCLRGTGTEPEQAELVAEPSGGSSELAVAFVQSSSDGRF
jgi:hypothetical protein